MKYENVQIPDVRTKPFTRTIATVASLVFMFAFWIEKLCFSSRGSCLSEDWLIAS
jgi:hypothetical protein